MSKNYALKLNTPHDEPEMEIINNAKGDIVLDTGKSYRIICEGDVNVSHIIENNRTHIICESNKDNININITCIHTADNGIVSDIYHKIINKNKNVRMNIIMKAVLTNNSRVIYRSSLSAIDNSTGTGEQEAKFLILDNNKTGNDNTEVDAIPALDIHSPEVFTEHKLSISRINAEDIFYLGLFGYDESSAEQQFVNIFLK